MFGDTCLFLNGEHFWCWSGEQQPLLTAAAHLGRCHLPKTLLKHTHRRATTCLQRGNKQEAAAGAQVHVCCRQEHPHQGLDNGAKTLTDWKGSGCPPACPQHKFFHLFPFKKAHVDSCELMNPKGRKRNHGAQAPRVASGGCSRAVHPEPPSRRAWLRAQGTARGTAKDLPRSRVAGSAKQILQLFREQRDA